MLGKSEYTGERFVPGIEDQKLTIEHMQRYKSVVKLAEGKNVIDIACGEGYGTALLAEKASGAIGIDIDAGAIKRAQERYQGDNLSYQVGSVEKIPAGDASVDLIVSFETIEHVSEQLQQAFLIECTRVLKPDGVLIMSTPNKEIYSDRYNYVNEYHIHEFYHDEFLQFLKQEFTYIKLYNQAFQVISLLNDCENKERILHYFSEEKYETQGKYYIAIASNKPIKQPEISSVFVGEEGECERLIHRILQLQDEEKERNQHIEELNEELERGRARIAELQSEEEKRNKHIAELNVELEWDRARIMELQREEEERNEHMAELNEELEQDRARITELQHEEEKRNKHIANLNEELELDRARITELQSGEEERNKHIAELDEELERGRIRIEALENKLKQTCIEST